MTIFSTVGSFIVLVTALFSSVVAQSVESPINTTNEMTFRAVPAKTRFLPLEPIAVHFLVLNETRSAIEATPPNFFSIHMEVVSPKGLKTRLPISFVSVNRVVLPRQFKPGESVETDALINANLASFFPTPGVYKVKFILPDDGSKGSEIASEEFAFRVVKATGKDAEALRALEENQKNSSAPDELFRWTDTVTESEEHEALEAFVDKYQLTVYGEYATLHLGNYYLARRNLEAAKVYFNRIVSTSSGVVRSEAVKALQEISKTEDRH